MSYQTTKVCTLLKYKLLNEKIDLKRLNAVWFQLYDSLELSKHWRVNREMAIRACNGGLRQV